MWKSGPLCKLVLGLSTHECSTGQQPFSLGAGLYGLSYDCFFLFSFSCRTCVDLAFFSPLATVGSDVSIRDGLNSWPVCVGFLVMMMMTMVDRVGRITLLLVWVMGLWKCGERGRERDIYVLANEKAKENPSHALLYILVLSSM